MVIDLRLIDIWCDDLVQYAVAGESWNSTFVLILNHKLVYAKEVQNKLKYYPLNISSALANHNNE